MAAFFSNISVKLRQFGSVYFLLLPFGGLVVYTILFNVTKASPLLTAGSFERVAAMLTAVFLAFALSFIIMLAFVGVSLLPFKWVQRFVQRGTLFVFAAGMTLFAMVAIENFSYTMFRVGLKTTDDAFAKTLALAVAGGLFWVFWSKGEDFRAFVRDLKLPLLNGALGISALVALYNLPDLTRTEASGSLALDKTANVIVISGDGIDAGRTSLYGYERQTTPFLDSIRDELLIARHAYPNNGNTTGAITSLLTGMLPTRTKVVFPPDSLKGENALRSLPRLLREQGYHTTNIAVPHYADASEQNMLGAFDANNIRTMFSSSLPFSFTYKTTNWLLDRVTSEAVSVLQDVLWVREMTNPYTQIDGLKRGYNYGNNDIERLNSVLGVIRHSDGPFFVNSHFLGPHGPFFNPPVRYFAGPDADKNKPWHRDLYDDAILSFDMYVKRIYTALEERGLLDDTILVIMSDHGVNHDPRRRIPLMIRFPDAAHAGRIIEENVQVVDVAPTLIDYLGGVKPAWMQGDSLIRSAPPADRRIFAASVKNIAFLPGVGVVGNEDGAYGTMDYFYMIHCGSQYRLNVNDGSFEVTSHDDEAHGCADAQELDASTAKAAMKAHLEAHY